MEKILKTVEKALPICLGVLAIIESVGQFLAGSIVGGSVFALIAYGVFNLLKLEK